MDMDVLDRGRGQDSSISRHKWRTKNMDAEDMRLRRQREYLSIPEFSDNGFSTSTRSFYQ